MAIPELIEVDALIIGSGVAGGRRAAGARRPHADVCGEHRRALGSHRTRPRRSLQRHPSCRHDVEVARLIDPRMLVEIEADAFVTEE